MRMAGPREALWHALIRRNFGASHLIVGRDHASPGVDSRGKPYWGPYAAQELVAAHAGELGVEPLAFEEMVYLEDAAALRGGLAGTRGARTLSSPARSARPLWRAASGCPRGTRPEVAEILAEAYPPRHAKALPVVHGLSGSGKSTPARDWRCAWKSAAGR